MMRALNIFGSVASVMSVWCVANWISGGDLAVTFSLCWLGGLGLARVIPWRVWP